MATHWAIREAGGTGGEGEGVLSCILEHEPHPLRPIDNPFALCDLCHEPIRLIDSWCATFMAPWPGGGITKKMVPGIYHRDCCDAASERARIVATVCLAIVALGGAS